MIEYIKGDLFTTDCKYIAHGCNSEGVMGSGVAKIVKEQFPKSYENYHKICSEYRSLYAPLEAQLALLGQVFMLPKVIAPKTLSFDTENGKVIMNCITQGGFGTDGRYVNYEAVYKAFESIGYFYTYKSASPDGFFDDFDTVAMPKIGAGLGGGDWGVIEAIINATLIRNGVKVKVYEL